MSDVHTIGPRDLAADEIELLSAMLTARPFLGSDELVEQLLHVRISGGLNTAPDFEIVGACRPSPCPDGPISTTAMANDADGAPASDILVWVTDGYLSGMENAWLSDVVPQRFPRVDEVVLLGPDGPIVNPGSV